MFAICFLFLASLFSTSLEAQRLETGIYTMSQRGIEITREIYRLDGTTLTDSLDFAARGIRMESVARYDDAFSPVSYTLDLFSGAAEVPVQQINVTFTGTAANWSTHTQAGDSTGITQLDGPYAFMQNLIFAHLAVVLLKYDHESGGTQSVNVWMPEQASTMTMEITFTSSTNGSVEIAGTVMTVEVDESGWLRRATVPSQNVTVESTDPGSSDL